MRFKGAVAHVADAAARPWGGDRDNGPGRVRREKPSRGEDAREKLGTVTADK